MALETPLQKSRGVLQLQRDKTLQTEHGAFHLHNLLGSGVFADVWRCKTSNGEWRAVKIVRGEDGRAIEAEAEIIRRCWESMSTADFDDGCPISFDAHRRIPEFFGTVHGDMLDSEGKPKSSVVGIVMEDVCGGDLGRLLATSFPIDCRLTRCIALDVIVAVRNLHSRKIMHRDIRPENILINREGFSYLTDFSSACSWADGAPSEFIGTPLYMAPEMVRRIPPTYDSSVDCWSFAMVCYEMMLGHTIWRKENGVDLTQDQIFKEMRVRNDVEDLWKLEPFEVPGNNLPFVVRTCMTIDPTLRWTFSSFIRNEMFFGAGQRHRTQLGSLLP